MLFSWNQLTDYLRLDIPHEELAERLSLVGFNHESTREVGGDLCLDLEITSNRPDCLNHLGIAREIGLLLGQPVRIPEPPAPGIAAAPAEVAVENRATDLCGRFEAITIRGTRVGPSPAWLARRVETLGFRPINNVVDATNYVMNEAGQPIHAYDLDKLDGARLVVRRARKGETADCLDHKRYELDESMLVIADATRPVCLAGVMGCTNTEVGASTANLAIEVARFDPINIRRTSRALGLQTQSSYRMERPIDPAMLTWARDRCVALILATGGGVARSTARYDAPEPAPRPPVVLRVGQVARILGIEVPVAEIRRILVALGLDPVAEDAATLSFAAPSWRSDLDREIDLVEEVGRIHDYARIPEDRPVQLRSIRQDRRGRIEGEVRGMLTGLGYSEAITYSFVPRELVGGELDPGPRVEPVRVEHATRKQANLMRLSLTPSLLEVAGYNEAHGNAAVHLFEVGNVYRPVAGQDLPDETTRLAVLGPGDFFAIKGVVEGIARRLHARGTLGWEPQALDMLRPGHAATITLGGVPLGFAGELAATTRSRLKLRGAYSVAEVSLDLLDAAADLIPQHMSIPVFPGVERDLSLVVPARTTWAAVEAAVAEAVDPTFEGTSFADSFRGGNLRPDEQSIHFRLRFRDPAKTMTTDEIDARMARIVDHCRARLGATVRA